MATISALYSSPTAKSIVDWQHNLGPDGSTTIFPSRHQATYPLSYSSSDWMWYRCKCIFILSCHWAPLMGDIGSRTLISLVEIWLNCICRLRIFMINSHSLLVSFLMIQTWVLSLCLLLLPHWDFYPSQAFPPITIFATKLILKATSHRI
jgi:hypothetical protein